MISMTAVFPHVRAATGPALSGAFMSADDAARYAHERVGTRRDRGYGSCIFKRDDGRFVVSEPLAITAESLDNRLLYPQDAEGKAIFAPQHTLHSFFYSHVALSMLDVQVVANHGWQRAQAITSLLMFNAPQLRFLLNEQMTAYLSGAHDSLIVFKPDTQSAAALLEQLGTAESPGPLGSASAPPDRLVSKVAQAGELEVVVSNNNWRPRGRITSQSFILVHSWERTRPQRTSFGAIFASADDAAQDCYLRDTASHDDDQIWFGFILKQKGKQQYIASELVPVDKERNVLFALSSLFPASGVAGGYRFPESFAVHSYFYSRPRIKHAKGVSKNWLGHNFIEPRDLFVSVYNAKKHPQVETGATITTYIAPRDGVLLKYTPRKDTRLFDNDVPLMGLEAIQSNLASGKVSTTDFVRVVANSGELSVLRTSLCWDRKGTVDRYWYPGKNLQRLALGAVFLSADDAAIAARGKIPSGTQRAYGGLILKRPDGLFVATDPIAILEEDFEIDFIFPDASVSQGAFPVGCTVVGRYRSRVARELPILLGEVDKQVYRNMLSVDVVCTAFLWDTQRLEEYLFCPDGAIIRFLANIGHKFLTGIFKKLGMDMLTGMRPSLIKQKIHDGWLLPRDWVKDLVKSGKLAVVVGSKLWGNPGAITAFAPMRQASVDSPTVSNPACSPLFTQALGVARFVHEQPGRTGELRFGALLTNARSGHYLASLPQEVREDKLTIDEIFPQGSLPDRHTLHGLYLRAPDQPAGLTDEDYRHFFSPLDVSRAHTAVYSPQGYKPIYFSCSDGALLRYEMSPFDADAPLDKSGQIQSRPNRFGSTERAEYFWQKIARATFSLASYIRQLAHVGKLEVLIPSPFWSRVGDVGADWEPRMKDRSPEEHWANQPELPLGPIYHHADDAARYAQSRAGSAYAQKTVYESAILAKSTANAYVALEPLAESESLEAMDRIFRTLKAATPRNRAPQFPDGYALIASHQLYFSGNTPMAADPEKVYANYASPEMVFAHTFALKSKGFDIHAHYYSTPHGALIKYAPLYSEAERRLLSTRPVELVNGQWETRLSPGEFISQLAGIAELRVLKAAYYWNQEGRVGTKWRTSRQQAPAQTHRPVRDEL